MPEVSTPETDVEGLTGALLRIAVSPAKTADLYAIFGEYCHVLRNRLNCLKLSLYLARRAAQGDPAEPWTELERQYLRLEAFIERFQTICRPMRLTPIRAGLAMLMDERAAAWRRYFEPRGLQLALRPPRRAVVGVFDPMRLGHGLDTMAAWRARVVAPGSSIEVAWWATERSIALEWSEPDEPTRPLADDHDGHPPSLALPLLARILASHGGTCAVTTDDGFRVSLRWPIDAPTP